MDAYETTAKFNIAESCAASISIDTLGSLSDNKSRRVLELSTNLTYGAIRGSEELRSNLATLYPTQGSSQLPTENILITPGAISANFVLLYTFLGESDHVICHYPTYQQLYSVPASLGADVSLWRAHEEDAWQLDIEELKSLIRPNTKMIIVKYLATLTVRRWVLIIVCSNPNNPTGAVLSRSLLEQIVEVAREHNLIVLSDEVYRPLFHSRDPKESQVPPSMLSMGYSKAVATGSMSKAYALAGIRVGWIASCSRDIIESCAQARDYTTISVSHLDDQVASFALSSDCVHNLLDRNIKLAQKNLAILERFIDEHKWACKWTKPSAGTTAFVQFSREGKSVDDVAFCKLLQQKAGVMFCPGCRCFGDSQDFKGYVRVGYVCETSVLVDGLDELRAFMRETYGQVPVVT